jgi:hypothetical protein
VPESVAEFPRVIVPPDETVVAIVGEALLTTRVSPPAPHVVVYPLLLVSPGYDAFQ